MFAASVIILGETWAVIVPVLSVLVSGIFTLIGYIFSNRAKEKDQEIVERTQDMDGIRLGKEFFQDALTDARGQITDLKVQNKDLTDSHHAMQLELQKITQLNERLTIQVREHERTIQQLRKDLEAFKESNNGK